MNYRNDSNPQLGYPQNHYDYYDTPKLRQENVLNFRKYFYIFLRNWYWFLISLGIALGIAFFKIRYTIPQYRATAKIIIEQEESPQDLVNQLRAVRYWRRQTDLANETAKITAYSTIRRAIDSLNQEVYWTAHGRIRVNPLYKPQRFLISISDTLDWYKGIEWYVDYIDSSNFRLYREEIFDTILPLNKINNINGWMLKTKLTENESYNTYSFVVNNPIVLSKQYKNKLQIESREESGTTITLLSEGSVGEREVDFLNTLSSIYILSELERKQAIANNTFTFIDDQISVILDSLRTSENQLLTFRLTNNVINLSQEGEIAYERLKVFNEQKTKLNLKADYYKYLYDYVEARKDPQTIIAPTLTDEGDQLLIAAVKELQELYKEREALELNVLPKNPGFESVNNRIKAVRIRTIEIVNGLIENNKLRQTQVETEEKAIISQLKTLPINEQELLNIKRKYDLYNQFYTFLLEKRAEAGIQKASILSNARILDPARHDDLILVGKDKKVLLLLALVLGIILPLIVLILRDLLDNRIKEREDIINQTDIPIIGIVGHATQANSIHVTKKMTSAFSESLRRIRTNMSFALREKDQKTVMITSSISGEGKTFSAANLASIIALNNQRVLILGCDLRKPTIHKIFGVSNDIGLTSYIIGQKTLEEVIFPTNLENLFIIPSGPIPPNPAELIETKEMASLFDYAKKEFDYILIDTPPIALVADALALATKADLTLYVVRQNHSHKSVIEFANELHSDEKLPKTYLLINDIKPSNSLGVTYYYGYGKDYHYGYGDTE